MYYTTSVITVTSKLTY